MKILVFALLVSGLVAGCANVPLAPEDARGIPESRMLQKDLLKEREGRVEIRFIRETAMVSGNGSSANLSLNGEPLARLWDGEKFSIWVEPRIYVIALGGSERHVSTPVVFSKPELALWKVEVDARIGRRYDVRVDFANWTGTPLKASSTEVRK
ncbi:MAG: hypothetical protein IPN05_03670 [Sulfuritalea sp.]|nr:hypothetical protein [Sulfuritalea sp.]